jgi:hypothetical protein
MPHIAIEIAEPSASLAPPALATALERACSVAVHDGDCTLEREGLDEERTTVAIVRWDDDERNVRIELGTRSGKEPRWTSRSLGFRDADERIERWRTVGLTIATLAGEADRAEIGERKSESRNGSGKAPEQPLRAHAERPPQPKEGPKLWLELGPLLGTALDTMSPRLGVWADVGARLGRTPLIGVAGVDYSAAEGSRSLSVQWLTLFAGLGTQVGSVDRGPKVEGLLSFSAERQHLSASDGTRSDTTALFGYGGRARAAFVWEFGRVSPVVGVEGWINASPVRIIVNDQYAGTAPRLGGVILVGIRARLE